MSRPYGRLVLFLGLFACTCIFATGTCEASDDHKINDAEKRKILERVEALLESRETSEKRGYAGGHLADDVHSTKDREDDAQPYDDPDATSLDLNYEDLSPNVKIVFRNIHLNRKAKIPMSKIEKKEFMDDLSQHLHGQTLDERMKVWSEMADYERQLENDLHSQTSSKEGSANLAKKEFHDSPSEFRVEDEDVYEGDIVLDYDDVRMLKENLEQQKLDNEDPDARLNGKLSALAKDLVEYQQKRDKVRHNGQLDVGQRSKDDEVNGQILQSLKTLANIEKRGKGGPEKLDTQVELVRALKHLADLEKPNEKTSEDRKKRDVTAEERTKSLTRSLKLVYEQLEKRSMVKGESKVKGDKTDAELSMDTRKLNAKMTKWPFPIQYVFDGTHSKKQRSMIHRAIYRWEIDTCVRFMHSRLPSDEMTGPHVYFHKAPGCSSSVGMKKNGNRITLSSRCFLLGKIEHELGHTLGMWHEQSRPDRDKYIEIMKGNIAKGKYKNFVKMSWKLTKSFGIPYDMSSDMHYGGQYFKTDDDKYTIRTKDERYQKVLGQRYAVSFLDVKLINYGYCSNACEGYQTLEWGQCQNGGYRNPNDCDRCKCPIGWSGRYCDKLEQGKSLKCGPVTLRAGDRPQIIRSPGYNYDGYRRGESCNWIIKAPKGKQVVAQFVGDFEIRSAAGKRGNTARCNYPFCWDWVEIRLGDLGMTGFRYCCDEAPKTVFRSSGNKMMVLFKSHFRHNNYRGFQLKFHAESCGGCSSDDRSKMQPACSKMDMYSCPGKYGIKCGFLNWRTCFKYRKNMCWKTTKYCCGSFKLDGDKCRE